MRRLEGCNLSLSQKRVLITDNATPGEQHTYRGPTLVLWGTADHLVPLAHAEVYATTLPCARLEMLDGVGHSVVAEQPAEAEAARCVRELLMGQQP